MFSEISHIASENLLPFYLTLLFKPIYYGAQ